LNEFGNIVRSEWLKTPNIRPNIELDEFIIMPNHLHGIIRIKNKNKCKGTEHRASTSTSGKSLLEEERVCKGVLLYAPTTTPAFISPSKTIGAIIRGYKSSVTKQINIIRKLPDFAVWQRNYYEHIIRNEEDLNNITQYIKFNPRNWDKDDFYKLR